MAIISKVFRVFGRIPPAIRSERRTSSLLSAVDAIPLSTSSDIHTSPCYFLALYVMTYYNKLFSGEAIWSDQIASLAY